MHRPKTFIYVNGSDLYFGVKETPFKWLNIKRLFELILPKNDIHTIKYFTTTLKEGSENPGAPGRQQLYLRALRTLPNFYTEQGYFQSEEAQMPLVNPPKGGPNTAFVIKTEEKGSDVNLACNLLQDAYSNQFEVANVLSSDPTLVKPIMIIIGELKKKATVMNPRTLINPRTQIFNPIPTEFLLESQFPATMTDKDGSFTKPSSW
jgi:hypothetical protein